jgi:hypothetical protein
MRFEVVQGDEQLSSHSGLALVGAILDRTSIRERLDAVALPEHPFPEVGHTHLLQSVRKTGDFERGFWGPKILGTTHQAGRTDGGIATPTA